MVTRNNDRSNPRGEAETFTARLADLFGDDLHTVLLYGSAARGEFSPGISDVNLLVILRELGVDELRRAAAITREWVSGGNPPPLMLSQREWAESADAFPIEYSDIRDSHEVLRGADPFGDIHIRKADLRLQLENELRSRKIQLREAYLAAGIVPDELGALLGRSLPSFLTLFRALLRLADRRAPVDTPRLIEAVAELVHFDPAPLIEVARGRHSKEGLSAPIDGPLASGYLRAVERAVTWLDAYDATIDQGELV